MRRWLTPIVLSCVLIAGLAPLHATETERPKQPTRKAKKYKVKTSKKTPKAKWGKGNTKKIKRTVR